MIRCKAPVAVAVLLAIALMAGLVLAQAEVPKLMGHINDYADLLDERQGAELEQALAQFESQSSTQVVLLTVPSLEGENIEGFSIRVADAWKIGQAGKDNGVILIVAPVERKVRIEVGYGLEGALTDLESSQIIRNIITPAFSAGNYYAGIVGGLDGIIKSTQGEFTAPAPNAQDGGRQKPSLLTTILMVLIGIVLISTRTGRQILFWGILLSGRGGGGGGGGGFSGGGGGFGGGGASGGW